MILAPLRGVTIRCFRETFSDVIAECGFTEAVTPFIPAMPGLDPMGNEELRMKNEKCSEGVAASPHSSFFILHSSFHLTPQFIGKDPAALRSCLERIKAAGYDTADLNAGCPFPMVRNKGRGSGLLKTPDVLRRMLEVGCSVMGEGKFSLKARLGVDRNDELLKLMPLVNEFPLRFLTVHARNARQMYEGCCDVEMLREIERVAKVPVVENGDIPFPPRLAAQTEVDELSTLEEATGDIAARRGGNDNARTMIGRGFIRYLGTREDAGDLLRRYIESSQRELCGDRPVLGRMKELVSYWKDLPNWRRKWNVVKICRSVDELRSAI